MTGGGAKEREGATLRQEVDTKLFLTSQSVSISAIQRFASTVSCNCARSTGLTSVLGAVSRDGVERQVGADVAGTDDGYADPVALHLGPQAVEVGLGGVFGGCV